jgi:hypothetical protein
MRAWRGVVVWSFSLLSLSRLVRDSISGALARDLADLQDCAWLLRPRRLLLSLSLHLPWLLPPPQPQALLRLLCNTSSRRHSRAEGTMRSRRASPTTLFFLFSDFLFPKPLFQRLLLGILQVTFAPSYQSTDTEFEWNKDYISDVSFPGAYINNHSVPSMKQKQSIEGLHVPSHSLPMTCTSTNAHYTAP